VATRSAVPNPRLQSARSAVQLHGFPKQSTEVVDNPVEKDEVGCEL
jgi:hypothetical protein